VPLKKPNLMMNFFFDQRLMKVLLEIEEEMKRVRVVKWGPRIIDLDIIFYDDLACSLSEEICFTLNEITNKVHPI
jgi:2-amino-4-hydroxy-6-hydroxymethyldihydropteridine diphosphokinase